MLRKTMLTVGAMLVLAGATPAMASDVTAGRFDNRARAALTAVGTTPRKMMAPDEGSGSDACRCSTWPRHAPREHLRH